MDVQDRQDGKKTDMKPVNILRDDISESQIGDALGSPGVLPPLGDAYWRALARKKPVQKWSAEIRKQALCEADEPLPVLTDELYADFWQTGGRLNFERLYFERRRRLGRAVISVVMEGPESPLLDSAIRKLDEVFSEVSWSLPAHVSYHPDGKDPLNIDLFCAETANLMGQCLNLLGPVLPMDLTRRIHERLQRDIFDNYLTRYDEFWWPKAAMNWNAVCHQGVLGAALAVERDPARLARMLHRAVGALRVFLSGFTPDGGCPEGLLYWWYGFGWFVSLNEQLEHRSLGRLSLMEGDAHIHAIAKFGPPMYLADGYIVNFSDAAARAPGLGADLLVYLGERLNEESCRAQGLAKYRELKEQGVALEGQRSDLFYYLRLFRHCPLKWPRKARLPDMDVYLPDLQVVVEHGLHGEFAAKAGHNGEPHNHNDGGSYLLHVDGERWAIEIGAPEYVQAFFGPKRYEFLAARSRGHSVPLINGCEQIEGREAGARIMEYKPSHLVMDLTRCYPVEAQCRECIRTFDFDKQRGQLSVEDCFSLFEVRELETAIIAEDEARFQVVPGESTIYAGTESHIYSGHDGRPGVVKRIVLKPKTLASEIKLSYTLVKK